ncbi:hypothetical protein CLNEO_13650 [Anaerotignum neopropionicum]|uniref:DUF5659 domain-containing protein n=1 Tax=Anaerotignum neopropionicum TaxID=36847 RepID=A0A136WFW0_9FIRM|nr:DUF5659 domain-containing protein [Anaerotignum neopropionicum]KXL53394.1 hypothetical protein CLNEO_13650 [Anaerotignum neopropionicum]
MRNIRVVHSLALMMHLVRNGFAVIKVIDSFTDKNLKVFLFEDSEELKDCMIRFKK